MICSKEKTKILFINPCLRPGGHTKLLSVGLASVMTYFDERGYEFELLDIDINDYDDEYVEKFIKNNKFDFILFGTIVTHYKWIKWLVNTIKKYQPHTRVIVGNSVSSSIPELFLQKTKADVVVIGEGEISAYEIKWNPKRKVKTPSGFLHAYPKASFKIINNNNYLDWITN